MSTTVGDLVINLGIKGTEKTVGALTSVKGGLGELSSMSLEAKASILAAIYAFERLTAASGAAGTGITNFGALTGLSMQELQKWQYAARQAGESNEDFAGSLKGVQNSISNMLLGKGAPEGLGLVSRAVKDFDPSRMRDTFYVMSKLQEAAQKLPKDIGTAALRSFGLSDNAISAMRRNAFRPDVFAKAPTYSEGEIKALDRANIAWSNLGTKIEMAFGHFNAMHGGQLVNDISKITDQIVKLVNVLLRLADAVKVFKILEVGVGKAAGIIGDVTDVIQKPGAKSVKKLGGSFADLSPLKMLLDIIKASGELNGAKQESNRALPSPSGGIGPAGIPSIAPKTPHISSSNATQNVELNQTNHFHGDQSHGAKKAVDGMKKEVGDYVKASQAKNRGA